MKFDKKSMLLYAITDSKWIGKQTLYEQVELAIKGGVTCVQLREKHLDKEHFLKEAISIRELCKRHNILFIINDNVDIAIECGADGVHVGQNDMNALEVRERIGKNMILGVSAHNVAEAIQAEKNGADYLGVGAVFSTSTKSDASVLSHETLKQICNTVSIPVVAIGGINKKNIHMLSGSGIDGIAVISAIFSSNDIENEAKQLHLLSENMIKQII